MIFNRYITEHVIFQNKNKQTAVL